MSTSKGGGAVVSTHAAAGHLCRGAERGGEGGGGRERVMKSNTTRERTTPHQLDVTWHLALLAQAPPTPLGSQPLAVRSLAALSLTHSLTCEHEAAQVKQQSQSQSQSASSQPARAAATSPRKVSLRFRQLHNILLFRVLHSKHRDSLRSLAFHTEPDLILETSA